MSDIDVEDIQVIVPPLEVHPILQSSDSSLEFLTDLARRAEEDTTTSKKRYVPPDREGGNARLINDYFAEVPKYTNAQFKQRYRMSRRLFLKIVADVEANFAWFRESMDSRFRKSFTPMQNVYMFNGRYMVGVNIRLPFTATPFNLHFLGSLDGMICVCLKNTCEMVVWNPLTCVYKKFSNSNSQGFYLAYSDALGLCVNSTNDYNVLHIKRRRGTMAMYICSMKLNSWKTVPFLKNRPYHGETYDWSHGTLYGEHLYFVVSQWLVSGQNVVLRYDVNKKVFSELSFPTVGAFEEIKGYLVTVRDELRMLVSTGIYQQRIEMWKLCDETWTRTIVLPFSLVVTMPIKSIITHYEASDSFIVNTE